MTIIDSYSNHKYFHPENSTILVIIYLEFRESKTEVQDSYFNK